MLDPPKLVAVTAQYRYLPPYKFIKFSVSTNLEPFAIFVAEENEL
jgi:hypothetical protein